MPWYEFGDITGFLRALKGTTTVHGKPIPAKLKALYLITNTPFLGASCDDFKSHIITLLLIYSRSFDGNIYATVSEQ